MATYIILSRFSPHAFEDPKDVKKMARTVSSEIKRECPKIKWQRSYAVTGRFDIVDIVEAADLASVESQVPRRLGNAPRISKARPHMERLGHSTSRMTLEVYSHATAAMQDQAVAALDAACETVEGHIGRQIDRQPEISEIQESDEKTRSVLSDAG